MKRMALWMFLLLMHQALFSQFGLQQKLEDEEDIDHLRCLLVDVDNDGLTDILSRGWSINWRRNLGDGMFSGAQVIHEGIGTSTEDFVADDFDGDGLVDLMVIRFVDGLGYQLSWSKGTGSGLFDPYVNIAASDDIARLARGQLITGGPVELLMYHMGSGFKWLAFSNGGWSVSEVASQATLEAAQIVDLDADGINDVIAAVQVSGGARMVHHWRGDGQGGIFMQQSAAITMLGAAPMYMAMGDIDDNGTTDIAVSGITGSIAVLRTTSTGEFIPFEYQSFGLISNASNLTFSDLDDNGENELLFNATGGVYRFKDGSFRQNICQDDGFCGVPMLADLDNDADTDLFRFSSYMIGWSEYEDGSIISDHLLNRSIAPRTGQIAGDDVNDDGSTDLILLNSFGLQWISQDNYSFGEPLTITNQELNMDKFEIFDSNGDNRNDVLMSSDAGLILMQRVSSGVYSQPDTIDIGSIVISDFACGDMDGDDATDIIVLRYDQPGIYLLLNSGTGSYATPQLIYQGSILTTLSGPVRILDLNGDGLNDICTIVNYDGYRKHINTGSVTFMTPTLLLNQSTGSRTIFSDFDGDSDIDILSSNQVYLNNGSGVFAQAQVVESGNRIRHAEDVDGDGTVDLIGAVVHLGGADGEYVLSQDFGYPLFNDWPMQSLIDLNGDGLSELVELTRRDVLCYRKNLFDTPYRIQGQVYADLNENDVFDSEESALPNFPVQVLPYPGIVFSDSEGAFDVPVDAGGFSVNAAVTSPYWVSPSSADPVDIELVDAEPISSGNLLGVRPIVEVTSIEPSMTFTTTGPCGAPGTVWVSARNTGTRVESGIMDVVLDESYEPLAFNPAPDVVNGNSMRWSFDSLGYFGIYGVAIQVVRPLEEMPLLSHLVVQSLDGIGNMGGIFLDSLEQTNQCSFDPNDKQVFPVGYGISGAVPIETTSLEYVVRFQNTGTAPAYDIYIEDVLPEYVNIDDVMILGYSHPPDEMRLSDDHHLWVKFGDILLPDSSSDPIGSQGYIRLRVGLISGAPHLTAVDNTASITFDFNAPIVTNTTRTTLVDCSNWVPTITTNDWLTLESVTGDDYQWFMNGMPIFGAVSRTFSPSSNGDYSVSVTNSVGCTSFSELFQVLSTATTSYSVSDYIFSPNPVFRTGTLTTTGRIAPNTLIELIDVWGRVVQVWGSESHALSLNGLEVSAGLYLLRLTQVNGVVGYSRIVIE
ncbi:MAG: T9SS type A sorting domain-containing protein [Flavobacteriales bacterium]|nr:T9SS type A sorting domain-containing protein [Flavobacteriales bacterium]